MSSFLDDFFYFLGGWTGLGGPWNPQPTVYAKFDDMTPEEKQIHAKRFLEAEAIILGIAAGAGTLALQFARKSKKKPPTEHETRTLEIAEGFANRTTSLAAAAMPAFGLPIAYITVQMLEEAGYIRSGLGNDVQGILTGTAFAPAIGTAIGSTLGSLKGRK